jgi:hypothetical protein
MPSELPNIATAEASTMWEYYGLNQNARFLKDNRIWSYDTGEGKYTDAAIGGVGMRWTGNRWLTPFNMYNLDTAKEIGAGAPFGGYAPKTRSISGVDQHGVAWRPRHSNLPSNFKAYGHEDTTYKYARYKKVDQGYGRWKHEQAMQKLESEAEEARLVDRRKLANIRAKGLVLENTMKKKFSTALQQKQDVMDLDVADTGKHIANTSGKFNKKKWSRIAKAAKVASTGTSRRPI